MTPLLLLALLHLFTYRSPVQAERDAGELVRMVYEAGGLGAIAVVSMESQFNPRAERREPGGTSYGLFQLYDLYHPQFRNDLNAHIAEGARFLEECKGLRNRQGNVQPSSEDTEHTVGGAPAHVGPSRAGLTTAAPSFSSAVARYNGGTHPGRQAREWGKRVAARRDSLAFYLWRHLR